MKRMRNVLLVLLAMTLLMASGVYAFASPSTHEPLDVEQRVADINRIIDDAGYYGYLVLGEIVVYTASEPDVYHVCEMERYVLFEEPCPVWIAEIDRQTAEITQLLYDAGGIPIGEAMRDPYLNVRILQIRGLLTNVD